MKAMLKVQDVRKEFGGLLALSNVNFEVYPGEILGIIGPNGAGKTTIFNLITRVYDVTDGLIEFKGEDLSQYATHEIVEKGITRTFQNIRLFQGMTAIENVVIGQHSRLKANFLESLFHTSKEQAEEVEAVERAEQLLELVGLSDAAYLDANSLSYGDRRRLEIARACASEPELLLLDEPAAGMNEQESRQLLDLIETIQEKLGITVVIIEHDMNLMMNLCDRMVVLNFGRMIAEGKPEEIQENPEVIEAYLGREDDA